MPHPYKGNAAASLQEIERNLQGRSLEVVSLDERDTRARAAGAAGKCRAACHFPVRLLELGVQISPAIADRTADAFTSTHWSVIVAAGETQADAEISQAALAQLCETYWPPLYAFARGRGHPRPDAQDLTQGFFAYLIEHKIYQRADREKGKFRSFLLASFKNFLADARDRGQALKRGGGYEVLVLDEAKASAAESLFQTRQSWGADDTSEDRLFERTWAETLVSTALERVAAAYKADAKETLFAQLKDFLTVGAAPLPTYAELATRLGIVESTLRSHVTRLRARYREILRAEVRRTVNTEAEVDNELRDLLRVLSNAC